MAIPEQANLLKTERMFLLNSVTGPLPLATMGYEKQDRRLVGAVANSPRAVSKSRRGAREEFLLSWLHFLAFLRVTTNSRTVQRPITPEAAIEFVDCWLDRPHAELLGPGTNHWPILRNLLRSTGTAGNLASDARVAALVLEQGCDINPAVQVHGSRRPANVGVSSQACEAAEVSSETSIFHFNGQRADHDCFPVAGLRRRPDPGAAWGTDSRRGSLDAPADKMGASRPSRIVDQRDDHPF